MNWYKKAQINTIEGQPKDCFRNARLTVKQNPEAEVVQGQVWSSIDHKMVNHAWVELGDTVYDPTIDLQINKNRYYELTNANIVNRLNSEEVQILYVRTGRDDLYTPQEIEEYRQIRNRLEESYKLARQYDALDYYEDYEENEPPQSDAAEEMLPKGATDVSINENGRSARGKCPCPKCGIISEFSLCADVGGIWVQCEKCGLIDW